MDAGEDDLYGQLAETPHGHVLAPVNEKSRTLRASKIMQERARGKENIDFLTPYKPLEFVAGDDGKIAMIRLEHAETGDEKQIDVGGVFVAIGHRPRSELVKGQVELDGEGYVVVDEPSTKTKLAGVFAIGDLVDHTYRQAVTAAGRDQIDEVAACESGGESDESRGRHRVSRVWNVTAERRSAHH